MPDLYRTCQYIPTESDWWWPFKCMTMVKKESEGGGAVWLVHRGRVDWRSRRLSSSIRWMKNASDYACHYDSILDVNKSQVREKRGGSLAYQRNGGDGGEKSTLWGKYKVSREEGEVHWLCNGQKMWAALGKWNIWLHSIDSILSEAYQRWTKCGSCLCLLE